VLGPGERAQRGLRIVGESLMRADDPEAALRALTGTEHDTGELSL